MQSKTKKAIIFGTGSFAELVHYFLTHDSEYEVVAFTVSKDQIKKPQFMDLPLIPFEEIKNSYSPNDYEMYIAVGYNQMNSVRERFYKEAKQKGYVLLTYVSSYATVFTDKIGDNCFVFEDNTIQPFVEIGNNVVLWSGNHVGHHVRIGHHNWFCSHIIIGGHSKVKDNCFIGGNTSISDQVVISSNNFIGSHAMIVNSTLESDAIIAEKSKVFHNKSHQILDLMMKN